MSDANIFANLKKEPVVELIRLRRQVAFLEKSPNATNYFKIREIARAFIGALIDVEHFHYNYSRGDNVMAICGEFVSLLQNAEEIAKEVDEGKHTNKLIARHIADNQGRMEMIATYMEAGAEAMVKSRRKLR